MAGVRNSAMQLVNDHNHLGFELKELTVLTVKSEKRKSSVTELIDLKFSLFFGDITQFKNFRTLCSNGTHRRYEKSASSHLTHYYSCRYVTFVTHRQLARLSRFLPKQGTKNYHQFLRPVARRS